MNTQTIIRGTTPTHMFTLPFEDSQIEKAILCYAQSGSKIIRKTLEDCETEGNLFRCRLTQEDTLKINAGVDVLVQLKILTVDGNVVITFPRWLKPIDCLCDEVL